MRERSIGKYVRIKGEKSEKGRAHFIGRLRCLKINLVLLLSFWLLSFCAWAVVNCWKCAQMSSTECVCVWLLKIQFKAHATNALVHQLDDDDQKIRFFSHFYFLRWLFDPIRSFNREMDPIDFRFDVPAIERARRAPHHYYISFFPDANYNNNRQLSD